jgi:hypothetical protein
MAAMVLALGLAARGSAQMPAYELCIEQSPAQAGKLTPDSGMHRFSVDTVVVVFAEPQPGYQFAYWLGDVADPKSQRTTVQVNSSKIVVAVFQPADRNYPKEALVGGGGGGGGGSGTVATRIDLSTPGWSGAGGGGRRTEVASIVVPVPAPVPEPATVILLGLGALALRKRLR